MPPSTEDAKKTDQKLNPLAGNQTISPIIEPEETPTAEQTMPLPNSPQTFLNRLSNLEADWDGFGAETMSEPAVTECRRLLGEISQHPDQPAPQLFIAPLPDGGLELEWDGTSGSELMVVIPPEGTPARFLLTTLNESGQETQRDGVISQNGALPLLLDEVRAQSTPDPTPKPRDNPAPP